MDCPKCGAEVTKQAVYCHRCGERIDLADQEFPSAEQTGAERASEAIRPGQGAGEAPAEPAPSPAEKLKQAATARQDEAEEPEEELWQGGYSSKAMIGAWALSGLITVALVVLAYLASTRYVTWPVVALVVLLWLYQLFAMKYRQWNVRYQLTSQRFIHQTGILRRVTDRIELIDIDDITFEQSLLERLVGVGTIRISSSDRTHPELLLRGIQNVKDVAGNIDDTRRSERRRRGLHIESI